MMLCRFSVLVFSLLVAGLVFSGASPAASQTINCPANTDTTTGLSDPSRSAIGGGISVQPNSSIPFKCYKISLLASNFSSGFVINPSAFWIGIFTNGSIAGGDTIRVKGGSAISNISFGGLSGNNIALPASTSAPLSEALTFTLGGTTLSTTIVKPPNSNTISAFTLASPDSVPPTLTKVLIASSNVNPALAKPGDTITVAILASEALQAAPAATIAGQTATVTGSGTSFSTSVTVSETTPTGAAALSITNFTDVAGNVGATVTATTDGSNVSVDTSAPTVTISDVPEERTTNSPFTTSFTFSEAVTNFDIEGIEVENGAASRLSGSGKSYSARIKPRLKGTSTVSVVGGGTRDAAGNVNKPAGPVKSYFNAFPLVLDIRGVPRKRGNNKPFTVRFAFNLPVTGFTVGDISTKNAAKSKFRKNGRVYSAQIKPLSNSPVSIFVDAGAARDAKGRVNPISEIVISVHE